MSNCQPKEAARHFLDAFLNVRWRNNKPSERLLTAWESSTRAQPSTLVEVALAFHGPEFHVAYLAVRVSLQNHVHYNGKRKHKDLLETLSGYDADTAGCFATEFKAILPGYTLALLQEIHTQLTNGISVQPSVPTRRRRKPPQGCDRGHSPAATTLPHSGTVCNVAPSSSTLGAGTNGGRPTAAAYNFPISLALDPTPILSSTTANDSLITDVTHPELFTESWLYPNIDREEEGEFDVRSVLVARPDVRATCAFLPLTFPVRLEADRGITRAVIRAEQMLWDVLWTFDIDETSAAAVVGDIFGCQMHVSQGCRVLTTSDGRAHRGQRESDILLLTATMSLDLTKHFGRSLADAIISSRRYERDEKTGSGTMSSVGLIFSGATVPVQIQLTLGFELGVRYAHESTNQPCL